MADDKKNKANENLELRLLDLGADATAADRGTDGIRPQETAAVVTDEVAPAAAELELHLLDISVNDFSGAAQTVKAQEPTERKAKLPKSRPEQETAHARGVGRIPAPVVISVAVAFVTLALSMTLKYKPEYVPAPVRAQVERTTAKIKKSLPTAKKESKPLPARNTASSAPTLTTPTEPSSEDESALSEEDRLAKVDPVWRKRWETYKRLFIMANQMKQQPPPKPQMPNARPEEVEPPHEAEPIDDDEGPNPFGFPE